MLLSTVQGDFFYEIITKQGGLLQFTINLLGTIYGWEEQYACGTELVYGPKHKNFCTSDADGGNADHGFIQLSGSKGKSTEKRMSQRSLNFVASFPVNLCLLIGHGKFATKLFNEILFKASSFSS